MIVYCLKKIEPNGEVFYETPEMKYFTSRIYNAQFYETIEEVTSDMQYHIERDKQYAETLKNVKNEDYILPKYGVAIVEIKEELETFEKEK